MSTLGPNPLLPIDRCRRSPHPVVEFAMRPRAEPLTRWVYPGDGQAIVTASSGRRRVPSCVWGLLRARGQLQFAGPAWALHTDRFVLILMGG